MNQELTAALESAVARALRADGRYVAELQMVGAQAVVDAQWAAHRAARALGMRVWVSVRESKAEMGPTATMLTVTAREPERNWRASGVPRQRG
jgi:hypothetical protein